MATVQESLPETSFAFFHTLLVLRWGKGEKESPLGPGGGGGGTVGATAYLDPMLSVEVSCPQAGIEAVAQALQQPHSWEQLTLVLKPSRERQVSPGRPRTLKLRDFPPPWVGPGTL